MKIVEKRTNEQLERELASALTEGEMAGSEPGEAALQRLGPTYIARARAERDPIVEETKSIRRIVREVDDRYDEYMAKAGQDGAGKQSADE